MTQVNTTRRRWPGLAVVAATVSFVVLYLWDDVLLAAPVVALTKLAGPWVAFGVFSIVYALGSFVLALLAVRAYERRSAGQPSRFAGWLTRQTERSRKTWARRVLASGKAIGFVVSSFALGGILTTWLIRYGGRRRGIERVAALSSLIFGATFAAMYTGIAQAVFSF